jgi:hypothetical protein
VGPGTQVSDFEAYRTFSTASSINDVVNYERGENSGGAGERFLPTLALYERAQHGFQGHLSLSRAYPLSLKVDPSFIEAIEGSSCLVI